ncbi:conjugal transfer protein [Jeotgalibacillus proteolyticus]|uniref:Conjugal transfer protein n=1 Tax=Jeotgalibacillus proteolyticus TaxID=2082395 RepID=A0A2S5G759_9BACL|nr:conjugal transfer protein [Jeotgalibacillus proteolyticus]PPA68687.1 conjugal transfer protein [Jeotgalibacillus proteolyticus]PPA68764.1 conjugal transfer protein [Jeotgalibacillus proteolyticus]
MKKREYPKTVFRKKVFKGAFWTVFSLALFLSVVSIIRVANATEGSAAADEETVVEEEGTNHATGVGAQTFAQNFAENYFIWENTDEGKEDRVDRLSEYLAAGLDSHAGLGFEGMEWDSRINKTQIWSVEETGNDSAVITLRVLQDLRKGKEKAGPYEKYFAVPVKTDGQSFVVNQTPYIVPAPEKPELAAESSIDDKGRVNDSALHSEVEGFLNTFFRVYANGEQNELSYYTESNDLQTMDGALTFKEVQKVVVKQGETNEEFLVETLIGFEEKHTKASMAYPYELRIFKEDGRWIVRDIKNK